jgi:menaquinone-9 beta-reductase
VTDVIVCGGGVAGSSLAILLGRAGLSVEIFEQHRFPREKTCAEGLFPAGVGVLQRMGLLDAVGGVPICGVRHHAFGQVLSASFPSSPGVPAFGLGQRRRRLDSILFETARATPNVVAREGVRVEAPIVTGGRVIGVIAGRTQHYARLIVAADGPRSTLRRQCGLDGPPDRRPRLGVRGHFRLAPGVRVPERVEVFFTNAYELYLTPLPHGEVVLAGLAERASIDGDPKLWMRARIEEHAELRQLLDGAEAIGPIAGQGPLSSRARRGFVPGLVLLGDAAGFVDPVTGTGMAQALLAAELLAQTLTRPSGFDPSDEMLAGFERQRRKLLSDSVLLTRFVLELTRHPRAARAMMHCMRTVPGLYTHMVGVAGGTRTLLPFRAL